MGELAKLNDWSGGINNIAQPDRLPAGQVRDLVNLDPVTGGALHIRATSDKLLHMESVHGAVPYLDGFLLAAGTDLVRVSCATSEAKPVAAIAGAGGICGAELNGDAFVCSATDAYRVRGDVAGPWGLPEIMPAVEVTPGSLPAGIYRVAVTAVDQFGAESGCAPMIVTLAAPGAISLQWVAPTDAHECRVYASQANGETLYLQATAQGAYAIASVADDSARLLVGGLCKPPLATAVHAYKGRLLLECGSILWMTEPYAPGLVNPVTGFIAYSGAIEMILPVAGGIYVAAGGRTYFVIGAGTEQVQQQVIREFGAVRGSGMLLPDGRATWLTRYGQAFGDASGAVQLPQEKKHAPIIATQAAAGLIEGNGCQMAMVSLRGIVSPTTLGVQDTFDGEIDE